MSRVLGGPREWQTRQWISRLCVCSDVPSTNSAKIKRYSFLDVRLCVRLDVRRLIIFRWKTHTFRMSHCYVGDPSHSSNSFIWQPTTVEYKQTLHAICIAWLSSGKLICDLQNRGREENNIQSQTNYIVFKQKVNTFEMSCNTRALCVCVSTTNTNANATHT